MERVRALFLTAICLGVSFLSLKAELSLPNVFSDHLVLQRNQQKSIWGKADVGEEVTVSIAGQKHSVAKHSPRCFEQIKTDALLTALNIQNSSGSEARVIHII